MKYQPKQRNIANIRFSRCQYDNNLQLPAHTIDQSTLIYNIRVNISAESEINRTMTEDSGKCFYIKAVFCTVGGKGVAELVIIMITDLSQLQYLLVAILHSSRLNRLIRT